MSTWHSLDEVFEADNDAETERIASLAGGRTDLDIDTQCPACGYLGKSVIALKRHVIAKERTGDVHR